MPLLRWLYSETTCMTHRCGSLFLKDGSNEENKAPYEENETT